RSHGLVISCPSSLGRRHPCSSSVYFPRPCRLPFWSGRMAACSRSPLSLHDALPILPVCPTPLSTSWRLTLSLLLPSMPGLKVACSRALTGGTAGAPSILVWPLAVSTPC